MSELYESLRSRALAMLKTSIEDTAQVPAEDVPKLLHELQVHQMELEIQNEELRQAQIRLAQSRDLYCDLYEFAPVGYLTLDKKGVIRQANLTAATMLHMEKKQLTRHKFSDFVADDSQDAWHLHRRKVFAEPNAATCELRMVFPDGATASFRLQSLAFPDEQGSLSHCRTALLDESYRRLTVDALKRLNIDLDELLWNRTQQLDRSIEQLRLLSEAMAHLGEGVIITGDRLDWPGPRIIYVNEAMCRISGYTADELIGQTPRILQGDATDCDSLRKIKRDLLSRGMCNIELVNYRKDGTPYDAELFITPLFDTDNHRTHFVSIQRDITDRKILIEELHREHDFSRSIVNTIQNVTLVLDAEMRILQFNPYLEKITGWRFDEVKGRSWFEIFLPEVDRATIQCVFRDVLAGNITQGIVNPILTRDGQLRYIEWFNSQLTDSDGRLIGLLCTGQDVTVRRELERHIVEIANDERRRMGSDLHDGVGQELTGLSMLADALVISLSRQSRCEAKMAEKIRAGLQRTLAQVRTLSRGMNPVDIDAEGLMSALSEMSTQVNEISGVQCGFECNEPVLLGDNETATQLFRIAQEATTNAIRHAQPTEVTISLQRDDHHVVLRISDNGSGIGTDASSASGMGLRTMAYRARMIEGELKVHSGARGGTEVVCEVKIKL